MCPGCMLESKCSPDGALLLPGSAGVREPPEALVGRDRGQYGAEDSRSAGRGQESPGKLQQTTSRGDGAVDVPSKLKWISPSFSMPSQLSRVKAEGRLALLSANVAGAELLIQHAMSQAEEELERERRLSERRKSTEDFSVTQTRPKLERSRCGGPEPGRRC